MRRSNNNNNNNNNQVPALDPKTILDTAYTLFYVILTSARKQLPPMNPNLENFELFFVETKNNSITYCGPERIEWFLANPQFSMQVENFAQIVLGKKIFEVSPASQLYLAITNALKAYKAQEANSLSKVNNNNNNNSAGSPYLEKDESILLPSLQKDLSTKVDAIRRTSTRLAFANDAIDPNNTYIEKFKIELKKINVDEARNIIDLDQWGFSKSDKNKIKQQVNSFNTAYSNALGNFNQDSANFLFQSIYQESKNILRQYLKIEEAIVLNGSLNSISDENYKTNLAKLQSINWFANWFESNAFDLTFFPQQWVEEVEKDFKAIQSICQKDIQNSMQEVEERLKGFEKAKEKVNELKSKVKETLEYYNKTERDIFTIRDLLNLLNDKKLEDWILSDEEHQEFESIKKNYLPWVKNMEGLLKSLNDFKLINCSLETIEKFTNEKGAQFEIYIDLIDAINEKIDKINEWIKKDKNQALSELENIQSDILSLKQAIDNKNLPVFHDLSHTYVSLTQEIEAEISELNKGSTLGMSEGALLELQTKWSDLKETINNQPKLGEDELNQLQSNYNEKIQILNSLKEEFRQLQSFVNQIWQNEANRKDQPKDENMTKDLIRCRTHKITPVILKLKDIQNFSLSTLEQLITNYPALLVKVKQEVNQIIEKKVEPVEQSIDRLIESVGGAANIGRRMWEKQPNLSSDNSTEPTQSLTYGN